MPKPTLSSVNEGIVKADNLLANTAPKTYLTNTEVSGTSVFRWRNPNGFSASWAIQLGETGEEQTEVVILGTATPSGTAGTSTANSLYEHPADTPVYAIKYNQVVFQKSTTGTAGTATAITDGTITYQADNKTTLFDDVNYAGTHAYRSVFRNSVLGTNSIQSDWLLNAGFSFYSLANIRQRIKDKLWDASYIKNDSTIDGWINECKDKMVNSVIKVNEDYALGTVDVSFDGTDGYGTITTADFSQVRRVWVTYNGNDFFKSTKMNINDFLPDQEFNSTHPYHAWRGDTVFQIRPDESGGTARIVFYRFGTTMVNDTDDLPQPMRSYTDAFMNYGLAQALFKDGKMDLYDRKMGEYRETRNDFVNEIVPRDKSGPTYIDLVEGVSGDSNIP